MKFIQAWFMVDGSRELRHDLLSLLAVLSLDQFS